MNRFLHRRSRTVSNQSVHIQAKRLQSFFNLDRNKTLSRRNAATNLTNNTNPHSNSFSKTTTKINTKKDNKTNTKINTKNNTNTKNTWTNTNINTTRTNSDISDTWTNITNNTTRTNSDINDTTTNTTNTMRLTKYIQQKIASSAQQREDFISKGTIKVNGTVILEKGFRVDPSKDLIEIDYHQFASIQSNFITYALNKPIGTLSKPERYSSSGQGSGVKGVRGSEGMKYEMKYYNKFVGELVPGFPKVFPVGRLDKDTSGLIILTNNGYLNTLLMNPAHHHEKEYILTVKKRITSRKTLERMSSSIVVDGKRTRPCRIRKINDYTLSVVLTEGRNRQIRRLCRHVGNEAVSLQRIRIGNYELPKDLKEGQYHILTENEIYQLTSGRLNL